MEDRRSAHLAAFSAFDTDGSGQISTVDIHTALGMCDDLAEVELTEEDTRWGMRRHGVAMGGMMSFMQFTGVAEALYKRKVEPKVVEKNRIARIREERDQVQVQAPVPRMSHADDLVAKAFYAFDPRNTGEVNGAELSRMLQASKIQNVRVASIQTALAHMGKSRTEVFSLMEFRALHGIVLADMSAEKQTRVVPPMETVKPASIPSKTLSLPAPTSALVFLSTQQNLPLDLPPPVDGSQILTTPLGSVPSSTHTKIPLAQDNPPSTLPSYPKMPKPTQQPVGNLPSLKRVPTPQFASTNGMGEVSAMPQPTQTSRVEQLAVPPVSPAQLAVPPVSPATEIAPPQYDHIVNTPDPPTARHVPPQYLNEVQAAAHQQQSVNSMPSYYPVQPHATPNLPKEHRSDVDDLSLREVRVIGDETRLRASIEAHPHIKGWNEDYARHVGARGIVLRDMPKKNAMGVRFNDGKVAWYPSNCVIEYDASQPDPTPPSIKVPEPMRSVGPRDITLDRLFGGVISPSSMMSWVSDDGPPRPQQPVHQHHLEHAAIHCPVVAVDEEGDDVPFTGEKNKSPEKVDLMSYGEFHAPNTITDTSLPEGSYATRYCPPPRGNYKPPTVPKYDITELDAIYPLGKKKVDVKDSEIKLVYSLFDVDKTGEVKRSELHTMLRSLGYTVPKAEINTLFSSCGKSAKGGMVFNEFSMHAHDVAKKHKRNKKIVDVTQIRSGLDRDFPLPSGTEDLRTLFFMFDDSEEGVLTRNQLTICLNTLGLEDTHEVDVFLEVDRIFSNPNVRRDDTTINLEGFIRLVRQLQANKFAAKKLG